MIFSQYSRTDLSPRGFSESTFSHLDRSARLPIENVRQLIEQWASRLPQEVENDFTQRFRTGDDLALAAAFLELFTHELLLRTGHSIAFHPEVAGSSKRPDFLALGGDGDESVVECTLVSEESNDDRSADARLNSVFDAINKVDCPNFFLKLRVLGKPDTPVPGRKWRQHIQSWAARFDHELVATDDPVLELRHAGLRLSVSLIPRKQSADGRAHRPIGVQSYGAAWAASQEDLCKTIRDKASRYGRMVRPYVIVLNCIGDLIDDEDIRDSIYGRNGLWRSMERPAHTRVSAVLVLRHLFPWSINCMTARLFHNPNAIHPYVGKLSLLPQSTLTTDLDGCKITSAIGVDPEWPYWKKDWASQG